MTTDLELTQSRDIRFDATGDFAVVQGQANIRQQHVNALFRAVESIEAQLADRNTAADLELAIRRELSALSYVEQITTLTVEAAGRRTFQVQIQTDATTEPLSREVSV
jgi:predicted ATP-dependent protease